MTKAIQAAAQRIGDSSGIRFDLQIDNIDQMLPPEAEINLYRIVQECLNNLVKHSEARTASLEIERDERGVQMIIADDGKGFGTAFLTRAQAERPGIGLVSIVERARTLGGNAEIRSRPGGGTRIEVNIPIRAAGGTALSKRDR